MTVGDGTWDSTRNDFLLPNLVGLNFATMQYNGMGNRFRGLTQYHTLIIGHGVLAAIVFIGLVPAAIFIAKYGPRRHLSFKLHVYIQILVVMLTTVVLVLGWFAVGPERALSNPHHGIGVAIYVLVLVQFLWGWLMFKRERKRKVMPTKIPKKVWIHKLFGRSIALLGFVQIALGLTLYGSPKVLFILYALAGFFLLVTYLVLDYMHKPRISASGSRHGAETDDYSDYTICQPRGPTTPRTTEGDRHRKRMRVIGPAKYWLVLVLWGCTKHGSTDGNRGGTGKMTSGQMSTRVTMALADDHRARCTTDQAGLRLVQAL
jgi:hypothetical protein